MEKETLDVLGISETMLIPLYARALESQRKQPDFIDDTAIKIVKSFSYDFSRIKKAKMSMWGCAVRTKILDKMVKKHINEHPNCTIINIACGLDDRFSRVDNGCINWYNIDLKDVILLREKFIEPHERVVNIPCSALHLSWFSKIEKRDNILIIAEGFLMYLTSDEIKLLFNSIYSEFKNAILLAELMSSFFVKHQKAHDIVDPNLVKFKWGVDSPYDFCKVCDNFTFLENETYTKGMKKYSPIFITLISHMLKKTNNQIAIYKSK